MTFKGLLYGLVKTKDNSSYVPPLGAQNEGALCSDYRIRDLDSASCVCVCGGGGHGC